MSSKFFEKMNNFPLVRSLQILAVILFVWGIVSVFATILLQYSDVIASQKAGNIWFVFIGLINAVLGSLFSPLVLLALAEIIKQRKSV